MPHSVLFITLLSDVGDLGGDSCIREQSALLLLIYKHQNTLPKGLLLKISQLANTGIMSEMLINVCSPVK